MRDHAHHPQIMSNSQSPNFTGNRRPAVRIQAMAACSAAVATFLLLSVCDRGASLRTNQGVFAGVADPVALRQAELPPDSARAVAMTPSKPLLSHGDCRVYCGATDSPLRENPTAAINGTVPLESRNRWSSGTKQQASENSSFILHTSSFPIRLCQALGPAAPCPVCGVDCSQCGGRCRGWASARMIEWQAYAQGEYVGHARTEHVPEYRLRVDDRLDMIYRLTRVEQPNPYRLNVGDEISVESFTDKEINRDLLIQPDGTITLRLLGQVHATGRTVTQLRDALDELYKKYYKVPAITVTPLKVNTKLEDLRATVDRRAGIGGQSQLVRVTPEGTIALPALGSVRVQGLTLPEVQKELNERYWQVVEGIEVIPVLAERAPRYVYVLGEVRNPGRFELVGPTTATQALAMAGSYNVGANIRQIVVFRRGDDWRLLATMIDLEGALLGRTPCPRGEIWLDDSDVIIVPKGRILQADDFINLVFTRGIYGVFPLFINANFSKLSTL
jgi:polysaccharide biosynthesis/export protein